MNKKIKTIVGIILFYIIISNFLVCSHAFSIESANIKREYHTEEHLRYWNIELNDWYYVGATIVKYIGPDGNKYPAYCLNKELPGIGMSSGEYENYDVDVSEVISNNEIWRIIKNGYPYKTPNQMGVEAEEDAFLATKQAVYCILYNIDPSTYYISKDDIERGGSDERGDKIKNAIVSLVTNAKNSTEIYTKGTFTISKTAAKEDEVDKNYISSTYTLSSNFNLKDYSVYILDEMPEGTLITDLNNNKKESFSSGESFKIMVPKASLFTIWNDDGISFTSQNINFNIKVQANLKTYPILYSKSRIAGTQNYALTGEAYEQEETITSFEYITKGGEVRVTKTTSDTNYWTSEEKNSKVANAKYELRRLDTNNVIKILETNSDGEFNFTGIPKGEYSLQEIEAPLYYKKDENIYKFKITEELQIINYNLENSPEICGFFNIEKTSNGENIMANKKDGEKLNGAKYEIKDKYGKFIYSGITDEEGKFIDDLKLEPGEYVIYETEAPEGYILDKTIYNFIITETNGEKVIIKLKNNAVSYSKEHPKEEKIKEEIYLPKLPKTGF